MVVILSIVLGLMAMFGFSMASITNKQITTSVSAAQVMLLRNMTMVPILLLLSLPFLSEGHDLKSLLGLLAIGIAGYLPFATFIYAIQHNRLGVIIPITGGAPLVTLTLSYFFLNITLHPAQWVLISLVIIINIGATIDRKNWRESQLFRIDSGVPAAVFTAVGWGLYLFGIAYFTRRVSPFLAAGTVELGCGIAAGLYCLYRQPTSLRLALQPKVITNGLWLAFATVAFAFGTRYYNIGIVAALSNSQAVLTAMLGYYILHERLNSKEKIAGALMVAGVAAISFL